MDNINFSNILDKYIDQQGWNEDSQIFVLMSFLDKLSKKDKELTKKFEKFLKAQARDENKSGILSS